MADKKYTQKEIYEAVLENANNIEGIPSAVVEEFCKKKLAQLENKTSKVDTKKNEEHRAVMDMIIAVLCENDKMKCNEIMTAVNAANGTAYSSSKINAMLKKLLPADEKNPDGTGEVKRTVEKKDVYFSLAD